MPVILPEFLQVVLLHELSTGGIQEKDKEETRYKLSYL